MPRTFEASHTETIVVFVGHHLLAEFFFLNHCVSANTDALHFHKLNYIHAQTNTTHVKSVSFHIMSELELY